MNAVVYDIDFGKLNEEQLSDVRRKAKHIAWLRAIAKPVIYLHNLFLIFRTSMIYNLRITPQVCFLEKALNDRYDATQRRIVIDDPVEREPWVLFRKVEAKKKTLYRKSEDTELVLWRKSETTLFSVDFIVKVPAVLNINIPEFRSFLDNYKLVTKTYSIQFI